jgi:hypothetical protein
MNDPERALRTLEDLVAERLTALVELRLADVVALEAQGQRLDNDNVLAEYAQVRLFVARQNLRLAEERLQKEQQAQQLRRMQIDERRSNMSERPSTDGGKTTVDR